MQTVLIVIHLLVVLALIGVVLLQKSEGGALGIGGGGGGGFMTSRGSANVLTRATGILAAVFFATSLLLSILAGWGRTDRSIIGVPQPGQTAPGGAPSAPGGNILDQLKGSSGPQVPPAK